MENFWKYLETFRFPNNIRDSWEYLGFLRMFLEFRIPDIADNPEIFWNQDAFPKLSSFPIMSKILWNGVRI